MTYEEFEWELRAFLAKEVEMIRKTLPYGPETKKQKKQALKEGKVTGRPSKRDPGLHPGYLSGQSAGAKDLGGFALVPTESGYDIRIDTEKVYYAVFVDQPGKRTAGFWQTMVVDRFVDDLLDFIATLDPNAQIT